MTGRRKADGELKPAVSNEQLSDVIYLGEHDGKESWCIAMRTHYVVVNVKDFSCVDAYKVGSSLYPETVGVFVTRDRLIWELIECDCRSNKVKLPNKYIEAMRKMIKKDDSQITVTTEYSYNYTDQYGYRIQGSDVSKKHVDRFNPRHDSAWYWE